MASNVSPYTILTRWLHDGSKTTNMPPELENDKLISPTFLLYYFQQSKYILYLSNLFNNYFIYQLNKADIFKFMKQCVLDSGYKPPFLEKEKTTRNKLYKILKLKFPYLKSYEIDSLITIVDKSDDKDSIYETFGLYLPKKKKSTKADQNRLKKINKEMKKVNTQNKVAVNDVMANF
jgi:hypothetical protein